MFLKPGRIAARLVYSPSRFPLTDQTQQRAVFLESPFSAGSNDRCSVLPPTFLDRAARSTLNPMTGSRHVRTFFFFQGGLTQIKADRAKDPMMGLSRIGRSTMEISLRDLLTVLHGMGFGALFMLAFAGAVAELYRMSAPAVAVAPSARESVSCGGIS
jgi:hypothetical protein